MDKERFISIANIIKSNNIKLKVNTVVNKYNFNEKLIDDLYSLNVDRWKVLKMKDLKNDKFDNTFLSISNEDFLHFINLNKSMQLKPVIEESMVNTYIIIDSNGNLVDNFREDKYEMVADAKSKKFKEDFFKFNLNLGLYNERYKEE